MLASSPTDYLLDACPGCGGHLLVTDAEPPIVVQQVDILDVPLEIHEHRSHPTWCPHCRQTHYAPLPLAIERGGLAGPRLTTVIAYLKGVCHASFSTIRKFVRDVIGLTISRGQLVKIIGKVSRALERPYEELLDHLPDQDYLNVDETGHKQNRQRQWIWCFRAELYTLFKIDPTRSGDVLIEVLGTEFDGVLGCDYFSAYRRYHRESAWHSSSAWSPDSRREASTTPPTPGIGPMASGCSGFAVAVRGNPPPRGSVGGDSSQLAARAQWYDSGRTTCRDAGQPQSGQRFGRMGELFSVPTTPVCNRRTIWRKSDPIRVIDRPITQGTRSDNRWYRI
jgi:hypothetical protein